MTVVNLRLGGQGENCAQVMSHQSPFALDPSLYFLFSSEGRLLLLTIALNDLHRVGAEGKGHTPIKDLGSTSHTRSIDGEFHRQIAFIIGVVPCNPQRRQDVFGQLDIAT